MSSVVGVSGIPSNSNGAVELYAMSGASTTMHGWFTQATAISALSAGPSRLIAIEPGTLSVEVIELLRDQGHYVVVVPFVVMSSRAPSLNRYRRPAKEVCKLALSMSRRNDGYGRQSQSLTA